MHHDWHVNDHICKQLSKTLLFQYMEKEKCRALISVSEILDCGNGDQIIREGDESAHLYMVVSGQVSVSVYGSDGMETYLSTIGEGEIFGEAGIFLKTARTASVVSLGESRILKIHRKNLLEFIGRDPKTGIKVLMIIIYGLLRKLRESNQELAYERKGDVMQEDIDALVETLIKDAG